MVFLLERYTVTVNGQCRHPSLLVLLCPQWLIFVQCTVNWLKIHRITLFGTFELRQVWSIAYRHLGKPREYMYERCGPSSTISTAQRNQPCTMQQSNYVPIRAR